MLSGYTEEDYGFQSTPSARRATGGSGPRLVPCLISIHALREEGDCFTQLKATVL